MNETEMLQGTNTLSNTGVSPSQNLSSSITPTNSLASNGFTEFFNNLGNWFSDFFGSIGTRKDSIFNIAKNNSYESIPGVYNNSPYLSNVDLPDWVANLFTEAIGMFNENLNRQYTYNKEEAEKDRLWQEYMSNTSYQRAMEDLKKAGINPLLAFGGLSGASTPSGASASGSLGNSNSLFNSIVSAVGSDKKILASLLTALFGIFRVFSGKTTLIKK